MIPYYMQKDLLNLMFYFPCSSSKYFNKQRTEVKMGLT